MVFVPNKTKLKGLIEAAEQRLLIPFVGAGLSRQTTPPFPTWRELLDMLNTYTHDLGEVSDSEFNEINDLLAKGQFLMAAEHLRAELPIDAYLKFLTTTFDPSGLAPAEVHRALFRLNPPLILTTNYDRLLEEAYVQVCRRHIQSITYQRSDDVQRSFVLRDRNSRPIIFNIHGSVADPSTIILTESDYRNMLYNQPGYRAVLSAIFITHQVLMLGFSFEDRELIASLETLRVAMGHKSSPHYIFLDEKEAGKVRQRRLRIDYGLDVITYDNASGKHEEVLELIEYLIAKAKIPHPCS
jgi:hypothetical protein